MNKAFFFGQANRTVVMLGKRTQVCADVHNGDPTEPQGRAWWRVAHFCNHSVSLQLVCKILPTVGGVMDGRILRLDRALCRRLQDSHFVTFA